MTIKFKVMFFTSLIILIGGIFFAVVTYNEQTAELKNRVNNTFKTFEQDYKRSQNQQSIIWSSSLSLLLSNQSILDSFASRKRESLKREILNIYKSNLKPRLGIKQFQFHLSPAISFFRAHKPQKFMDDLSGFRQTVLDVNSTQKEIIGLEVGRGGPGLRIVQPLFYNQEHIGSVEFGGGIDSILSAAKERNNVGYAVGILKHVFQKAKRFGNQKTDVIRDEMVFYNFSDAPTKRHFKNLIHSKSVFNTTEGQDVAIKSFSLKDYSGRVIGEVAMIQDITLLKDQITSKIYKGIGFIFILIPLLLGVLWFIITRTIFHPLQGLTSFIKKLQQGKTTERYPVRTQDEISYIADSVNQLAESLELKANCARQIADGNLKSEITLVSEEDILGKALQNMSSNLNRMISQIATHAATLLNASDNLADITVKMSENTTSVGERSEMVAGASTEISTNTTTMASGVEEISSSIQSIASTSTEVSENMESVSETVRKMSESSSDVNDKSKNALLITNQAQDMTQSASSVMKTLVDSANEIGEVTNMIKEIAQQTNLLALNANIEAASAGEAGKGFAIVANEVKDLANQSTKSAQDISDKVISIQHNTDEAVKSITEITEIISNIQNEANEISNMANEQSVFSKEITANVSQSTLAIKDTANLIEDMGNAASESAKRCHELALGSNEISDNVNTLNVSIKEVTTEVKHITSESNGLRELSNTLSSLVGEFTLK